MRKPVFYSFIHSSPVLQSKGNCASFNMTNFSFLFKCVNQGCPLNILVIICTKTVDYPLEMT